MVRKYVRKTNRGNQYTKEDLAKAVEDVQAGRCTLYRASKNYSIPYTTIADHVSNRRGKLSATQGRPPVFLASEEKKLKEGIVYMEKHGFGLSKKEVLELVGDCTMANKIKTPFKEGIPGQAWFQAFKSRQMLSLKKPQSVEFARKHACDPFIINEYFCLLKTTLQELGLTDKPSRIWNLDETSFCTDPSKTKILGKKNFPATRTTSSSGRENITVLVACNAVGDKAPPLIIYKAKGGVLDRWVAPEGKGFPSTAYAISENGWMQSSIFQNFIENTFLTAIGNERPVLLIYDGHTTHIGINVIETARQQDIHILKLPPHSSHLLQPLDLSVFKSLKTSWDQKLTIWQRMHVGQKLPKNVFAQIVGELWMAIKPDVIASGFRKGGIYPFNEEVIPNDVYDQTALKKWRDLQTKANEPNISNETKLILNENNNSDPKPSTSTTSVETGDKSTTFEELLLRTVKQVPKINNHTRNKVSVGSELITSDQVFQRIKQKEKEKIEKEVAKKRKQEECALKKLAKRTKSKSNIKHKTAEDSDLDNDAYSLKDSSDDETLSELVEKERESEEEDKELFRATDDCKIGDWLLVKFPSKKTVKYYVGHIQNIVDGEPVVKFLRKARGKLISDSTFVYPEIDDISTISCLDDIQSVLPKPVTGRRGDFIFGVDFSGFDVQ